MRTKSTAVSRVIDNAAHGGRVFVTVYNRAGSNTNLPAEAVLEVEVNMDVDAHGTASVTLRRQQGFVHLLGSSIVGIGFTVVVSCGVAPPDLDTSPETIEIFRGRVDRVSWPTDALVLECSDMTADARDTWIERERIYGLTTAVGVGVFPFAPGLELVTDDAVVPSEARRNGRVYLVDPGGTTEAEPTDWAASPASGPVGFADAGATSDTVGVAVESVVAQVLADAGVNLPQAWPASPGWQVRPYLQRRESVLSAVETVVAQLGWSCRWQWYAPAGGWRLVIAAPTRTGGASVRTFRRDEERAMDQLESDVFDIRNVVSVTYRDTSDRTPTGEPKRKRVTVSDATSIAAYGRRFLEVQEADSSQIDTTAEATAMGNAILADLKSAKVPLSYTTGLDPYLEIGDKVTLPADNMRLLADTTVAVQRISHRFSEGSAETTLGLWGEPTAGRMRWLELDGRTAATPGTPTAPQGATAFTLLTTPLPAGARLQAVQSGGFTSGSSSWYEWHVSTTAGFSPTTATVKASGASSVAVVSDLTPGVVHYCRVVPFSMVGGAMVRGEPSLEAEVIPAGILKGFMPINGNLEELDQDGRPKHWALVTGTWSGVTTMANDSNYGGGWSFSTTGANHPATELRTVPFYPVTEGVSYQLKALCELEFAAGSGTIAIRWYSSDSEAGYMSETTASSSSHSPLSDAALATAVTATPSGARFAKVAIRKGATTLTHFMTVYQIFLLEVW